MKSLKKSFSWSKLWVSSHAKPSDFFLSSWQRGDSAIPLLVLRLVLAAAAVGIVLWSSINSSPHWFIYLTNWGLLMMATTMLSGLLVSLMAKCTRLTSDSEELPWYMAMYWFLTNVNVTIAVLITLLYWILLFDNEVERLPAALGLDISTHALNSAIALIDLLISRTPVRIAHFYQPLGLGLWYAAFTGIYYAAGGTDPHGNPYIYDVIDWRDGARAGAVIGISTAGAIVVYLAVWLVGKGRDKLSKAITSRTKSQDLPLAPPLTPEADDVRIV